MIYLFRRSLYPGIPNHETAFGAHIAGDLVGSVAQIVNGIYDPLFCFFGYLNFLVQNLGDSLVTDSGLGCDLFECDYSWHILLS